MFKKHDIAAGIAIVLSNGIAFALWWYYKDAFDHYLYPVLFHALWIIPVLSVWYFFRQMKIPMVQLSALSFIEEKQESSLGWFRHVLFPMRMVAIALLVMAFARPQSKDSEEKTYTKGIDIVLALDLSSSMLAQDLKPNRIEASKQVGINFIQSRVNDRFALVAYAGNARTLAPLTTDHARVSFLMDQAGVGDLEDGTAIGMGLGYAVNRLSTSDAASKVIILLTDGENNVRSYPPLTYAESAAEFGIKVYTIGVGKNGMAKAPVDKINGRYRYGMVQVSIDEETLRSIARITGGKYFRATNNRKLEEIYAEIDQMEKIEIEKNVIYNYEENFFWFALAAIGLLALEFVFRHTLFLSATG